MLQNFVKTNDSRLMLRDDNTCSSCLLLMTSSTLQAYLARTFRSPASTTTGDTLYSTSNSHQLMRMSCLTRILTTLDIKLQDSTSAHHSFIIQEYHNRGNLNFLLWPDMQERPSEITYRCLSFMREQTSSDIKLQDQISRMHALVVIEEHHRCHLNSF